MNASQKSYIDRILPLAQSAGAQLGIAPELIAAWWTWETAWGTNGTSKVHNHAGIGANSSGRDGVAHGHAAYNTPQNFVKDYVRVMSLTGYRKYEDIIAAAKQSPKDYRRITHMHNVSAWSVADYNIDTIEQRAKQIYAYMSSSGGGSTGGGNLPDTSGLSDVELDQYAKIGLAVVGIVGLLAVTAPRR